MAPSAVKVERASGSVKAVEENCNITDCNDVGNVEHDGCDSDSNSVAAEAQHDNDNCKDEHDGSPHKNANKDHDIHNNDTPKDDSSTTATIAKASKKRRRSQSCKPPRKVDPYFLLPPPPPPPPPLNNHYYRMFCIDYWRKHQWQNHNAIGDDTPMGAMGMMMLPVPEDVVGGMGGHPPSVSNPDNIAADAVRTEEANNSVLLIEAETANASDLGAEEELLTNV